MSEMNDESKRVMAAWSHSLSAPVEAWVMSLTPGSVDGFDRGRLRAFRSKASGPVADHIDRILAVEVTK